MSHIGTDIRLAFRSFRRQPKSVVAIMLTLALGTGAATSTYAVLDYALYRPVPGINAADDTLISVYIQTGPSTPQRTAVPHDYLVAMRRPGSAVAGLAAWSRRELPLTADSAQPPRIVSLVTITQGFFE